MIVPYSVHTTDPGERAFNKAYAKIRHHIENAFGLLVQKWRFLLRHLYLLRTVRMAYTITACCALHNFCLDYADNASQVPEAIIREFETEVAGEGIHENNANEDEEIEVVISNIENLEETTDINRVPDLMNISLASLRTAHDESQSAGRRRRTQMKNELAPLTETEARHHQAMMDERQLQRDQQRIHNDLIRQHLRRRRHGRRGGD